MKTNPKILKNLQGTLLGKVLSMEEKDMRTSDASVAKGEEIVGELNHFERALFTAAEEKRDAHLKIIKGIGAKKDIAASFDYFMGNHEEASKILADAKFLAKIMWQSIEGRGVSSLEKHNSLSIRKDNKIVSLLEEERDMPSILSIGIMRL